MPGQYGGYAFPSGSCAGLTGCGVGTLAGRIALSVPTDYNEGQYVGTVDRNLFRNNHLSAQLFWANISQITPTGGGSTLGQGVTTLSKNEHAALTDTETFTSNLINEAARRLHLFPSVPKVVENYTVSEIGQTKWDASSVPGISTYSAQRRTGISVAWARTRTRRARTPRLPSATRCRGPHGKHTVRAGFEWRRYRWNDDDEFDTRGIFSFANFDTFLEGAPSSDQIDVGLFARHYRAQDLVGFLQDDFRVTRRLTLNLGMRYDYLGFPDDTQNRIGNFDPTLIPASCIAAGGGNCMQAGFVSPASVPGLGTPGVSNTTLNTQDKNNIAPRIGLAWDVLGNGKLSLRSGFGMYYIRTSGTIVLQLIAAPPWDEEYRGTAPGTDILANPWPPGLPQPSQFPILPQIGQFSGTYTSTGAPVFLNANGTPAAAQNLDGFSRNLVTPYVEEYNLDLQYQLPGGWIMETGYIGSHGVKLTVEPGLNQALLVNSSDAITYNNPTIQANGYPNGITVAENSNANAQLRAKLPGFTASGLSLLGNYGYSHYNAGILELRHAYAKRFQFKFDYTFSHSDDTNSTDAASALAFNQLVPQFDYGPSSFDQRHRFVFTYVWDLPGPKTGWMGKTIGGWELSGVYTLQSGLPFSVTSNTGAGLAGESAGGSNAIVNSCTGGYIVPGSAVSNLGDYINKSCFSAVPNLAAGTILTGLTPQEGVGSGTFPVGAIPGDTKDTGVGSLFGTAQKDMLRGPFVQRFDMALIKNIPLHIFGEETNIQFRAEAFKLFNNVNFQNPAANVSLATFGQITSTIDSTGRILQLGLKLNF